MAPTRTTILAPRPSMLRGRTALPLSGDTVAFLVPAVRQIRVQEIGTTT